MAKVSFNFIIILTFLLICLTFANAESNLPKATFASTCQIVNFEVTNSVQDSYTKVSYNCSSNGNDVNILFIDPSGNKVYPITSDSYLLKDTNSCSLTKKEIIIPWAPNESKKIYQGKLFTSTNCSKESFFSAKDNSSQAIPDNNLIMAVFVSIIALVFITKKSK